MLQHHGVYMMIMHDYVTSITSNSLLCYITQVPVILTYVINTKSLSIPRTVCNVRNGTKNLCFLRIIWGPYLVSTNFGDQDV